MNISSIVNYQMRKYGHEGEILYSKRDEVRIQQAVFRQLAGGKKRGKRKGGKR